MNDLEVMNQMVKKDLDIRAFPTLVETKSVKQGGLFTMGVDKGTHEEITTNALLGKDSHYVILYAINKKQFDEIRKQPSIQEFMDQHLDWAETTFGKTPPAAPLHHLLKEIDKELIPELSPSPKDERLFDQDHFAHVREEFADCFILLMHAVKKYDISFDELYAAALEKFEKNKKRKWGPMDENGVSEHIKE